MDTMLSYVDASTGKRKGTGQSVYLEEDGTMEIETGAAKEAGSGFLRLQVMRQFSGVGNIGLAPFAIEEMDLASAMDTGEAVRISFGESTVVAGKVVDEEGNPIQGVVGEGVETLHQSRRYMSSR